MHPQGSSPVLARFTHHRPYWRKYYSHAPHHYRLRMLVYHFVRDPRRATKMPLSGANVNFVDGVWSTSIAKLVAGIRISVVNSLANGARASEYWDHLAGSCNDGSTRWVPFVWSLVLYVLRYLIL
ncbi:unnamed protein product [Colias eurytheme]|nr:unnamed protein product [Colias eurytheme]